MDKDRKHKTTSWGSEIPRNSKNDNIDGIPKSVAERILARRSEERGENPEKAPKNSGRSF